MFATQDDDTNIIATKLHDEKNLELIEKAFAEERIDDATREYLTNLYSDSKGCFREVFLYIGKCFGAPKAAVHAYDYETDSAVNKQITISDINPLEPYLVNHRLDGDPMRNQFFVATHGHQIDLAVSSIVTVIIGAQKSVSRALDKITGKLRKLTPIECERIDGFPDNWTDTGMPEKFRYFCMGNALVVNLIEIIATGISDIIEEENPV